jgi:hypothetical protein
LARPLATVIREAILAHRLRFPGALAAFC